MSTNNVNGTNARLNALEKSTDQLWKKFDGMSETVNNINREVGEVSTALNNLNEGNNRIVQRLDTIDAKLETQRTTVIKRFWVWVAIRINMEIYNVIIWIIQSWIYKRPYITIDVFTIVPVPVSPGTLICKSIRPEHVCT